MFEKRKVVLFDLINGLISNSKFDNVNSPRVRKQSRKEKFGHFRSIEQLFFFH